MNNDENNRECWTLKQVLMLTLTAGLFGLAGAALAEDTYKMQAAPPGFGQKMSFSSTKIVVADPAVALKFYAGVLGMKETGHYHNNQIDETMLKFDGDNEPTLVLVHYADNRKIELGTAYGNLLFVTPDIKGLVGKLRAGGYKVPKEPAVSTQMGIIVGFAEDPEGRPIELVEMLKK